MLILKSNFICPYLSSISVYCSVWLMLPWLFPPLVKAHSLAVASFCARLSGVPYCWIPYSWSFTVPQIKIEMLLHLYSVFRFWHPSLSVSELAQHHMTVFAASHQHSAAFISEVLNLILIIKLLYCIYIVR
jgi:hypothetical protein